MFLVNGIYGIAAGTWALIATTVVSLVICLWMLGRPPIMPFIAGAVSVTFGTLTLITGDAMWVQIKVTLFNTLVAAVLWFGLENRPQLLPFRFQQDVPLHRGGLVQAHAQRGAVFPRHSDHQRGGAARLQTTSRCLRSIASSPASTSGFCSRFSSSCPSRPHSSGGRSRLMHKYRLPAAAEAGHRSGDNPG